MIIIAGKNEIAIHGLDLALRFFSSEDVAVIVNATDSGEDGWQPSLLKYAVGKGVAVKTLEEVYGCDRVSVFLSLEFDKIVRTDRLRTDKIYNIHFSMLPKYKGMYTSIWPILFGDKESGVTLHSIDSGIDTGAIFAQKKFMLEAEDRSQDCYRKYISASKSLLSDNFGLIVSGFPTLPVRQDAENSTYFSKSSLNFGALELDFYKCAWEVKRQVHAFGFRPYQFLTFNEMPVVAALIMQERSGVAPGNVLSNPCTKSVVVSTIDYDVKLFFDGLDQFLLDIPGLDILDLPGYMQFIAGVNDRNDRGWSPIIVAAYHGRLDIVSYLLKVGANVNDVNYKGTTVLMYAKDYALRVGNPDIVKYLIVSGADQWRCDFKGKSIFDYISKSDADFLGLAK